MRNNKRATSHRTGRGLLCPWLTSLICGLTVFLLPEGAALGFGKKSDICGSWNNYCRGAPTTSQTPSTRAPRWVPKSQRYTTPRGQGWYCRARASNGAWGWGEHTSQSIARSYAVEECRRQSRGRACSIQYCRQGGPASAKSRRTPAPASRNRTKRRAAYDCSLCATKLINDVRRGWASARLKSYVSQALAGYSNCKRKASGSCYKGDIQARTLGRGCSNSHGTSYRACIRRIVGK